MSSEVNYHRELLIKSCLEKLIRFFVASKHEQYLKLSAEEKTIFDHMYPTYVQREWSVKLVAELADYITFAATTAFAVHVIAASMGLVLLSGVLSAFAAATMLIGISVIAATIFYQEFAVNRCREHILLQGGMQTVFDAMRDLTKDQDKTVNSIENLQDHLHELKHFFSRDVPKNDNILTVIRAAEQWLDDAKGLLSQEAVAIVKQGFLKQLDDDLVPASAQGSLKQVLQDFYQGHVLKKEVVKLVHHPDIASQSYRDGWRKLTKLPPQPELIARLNHDALYQDYMDNKNKVESSLVILQSFSAGLYSDDEAVLDRVRMQSEKVAQILNKEADEFNKKTLQVRASASPLQSLDEKTLVSHCRSQLPVHAIASGFPDLLPQLSFKQNPIHGKQHVAGLDEGDLPSPSKKNN